MKKTLLLFCLSLIVLSTLTSCNTLLKDNVPPGQEKKITGDKDASDLAPGKNK